MEIKNEKSYCDYCKKELIEFNKTHHVKCKEAIDKFNNKKLKSNILKYCCKILNLFLSMTLLLGL